MAVVFAIAWGVGLLWARATEQTRRLGEGETRSGEEL
jgi:hypothetical protein